MNIKDLLKINLDEEISTVVDLDVNPTEASIKKGLDSFVLTNSLARHLQDFLDEYNNGTMESGVWLSGFYGSGKSYFAQIIGLLLQNKKILGTEIRDRFSVKLDGLDNEDILRNELHALDKIKSHVVSFDASKHHNVNGLPFMIFSAFLRSLGMPDTEEGLIEFDLFMQGRHKEFLDAVAGIAGKPWSEVIKNNAEMVDYFEPAMLKIGYTQDKIDRLLSKATQTRAEYDAARLQQDLLRYIDANPATRLVFFIDEVSEAITQKKIRLDDLEGVAEALAALGRKVWTIAIAQQRLDDVIKSENIQVNSLTKVRDRFRSKIAIEADEVDTIILHRLLDKKEGATQMLRDYFTENSGIIADVSNIGVASLKKTQDADTYVDYYPFYKHQIKMLQYFLFGSDEMTQTRVGNRGMIISAFDVLKKEIKKDNSDHNHVNAAQLCNQADDHVEESISHRYRQAEDSLSDQKFRFVEGKKLLQTINFLTKSDVPTVLSNITKSYINRPDDYHEVLKEVKTALDLLLGAQIVILTGEQYRITNEAEQRILEDMRRIDVPSWEMIQDVNTILKRRDIVKWASILNVGGINVRFKTVTSEGEVFANPDENDLSIVFTDILLSPGCEDAAFVDRIRQETADTKGHLTIIPNVRYRSEIKKLITELRRLKAIGERTNLTDEERSIIKSLCSEKDIKDARLIELIEKSFVEGMAVYCFNRYVLNTGKYRQTLEDLQTKMFENVFFKRLNADLSEVLAPKVFTLDAGKLHNFFGTSAEFSFFDTSGTFIGANLAVVTEILALAKNYISGKEIENRLKGAPTGYSLGTVMTSVAALFRGNKIIVKYNGQEFTSVKQPEAKEPFTSATKFGKASFKAIAQGLTYKQRKDIVEILRDDCEYKKNTGKDISYNFNDFEIVDALRTLSQVMISKISNKIQYDRDYTAMFGKSVAARSVFQQYQGAVTEANFLTTAKTFLIPANIHEFIKAVEQVNKDIKFIDSNIGELRDMKTYIHEVKDQFERAVGTYDAIKSFYEDFHTLYENDIVRNYQKLKKDTQEIKDEYTKSFCRYVSQVEGAYSVLLPKLEEVRIELSAYPREWNVDLWKKFELIEKRYQSLTDISTNFDRYAVKSLRSGMDLRELANALDNAGSADINILALKAKIQTSDPSPTPPPTSTSKDPKTKPTPPDPKPYQPKTHRLKSQIPQGDISVIAYEKWLVQQLALLKSFNTKDSVNLNE